ncbi:MAG: hypothetical protein GY855_06785 [candidate division Zixibacteria bacterium]|nr:hypothetical protein [candidate division Zixibacteria bacterium]
MIKKRKSKIFHMILGLIFIALVFGSLSTLLSAKKLISSKLNANNINDAYIASIAGVEIIKNYIEINRITSNGKLPWSYHLNGALFKAEWSDYNCESSTVKLSCSGGVIADDLIIGKSAIDTVITIDYKNPTGINSNKYFGE